MSAAFRDPLTIAIAAFLRAIGLGIRAGAVLGKTALPGIDIERGIMVVDEDRLLYPGDLLHEAGHLAVAPAERRAAFHHDVGNDAGEEMMAIAWSYAAALHLGIDPSLVFHAGGYRGGGDAILDAMRQGGRIGVPLLEWAGLAQRIENPMPPGTAPYPQMIRWLRP